uniref:Uncharacterized protein n=1 Tax=Pipistrellus kuhlii TaxID=59472 RepID=A0A7J7X0B9_PIPKU|nr:hypothetical protein mPipKuh1_010773 [Pipistrellus kuhlii]
MFWPAWPPTGLALRADGSPACRAHSTVFWSHRDPGPQTGQQRGQPLLDWTRPPPSCPWGPWGLPPLVLLQGLHLQTSGSWGPALPAEMCETPIREHLVWPSPRPPCFSMVSTKSEKQRWKGPGCPRVHPHCQ